MTLIFGLEEATDKRKVFELTSDGKLKVSGGGVARGGLTNRSGITAGTANTWTEVCPANSNRSFFSLQNTSDTEIEVGTGLAGTEALFIQLASKGVLATTSFVFTDRIAVRCVSAASKSFAAREG